MFSLPSLTGLPKDVLDLGLGQEGAGIDLLSGAQGVEAPDGEWEGESEDEQERERGAEPSGHRPLRRAAGRFGGRTAAARRIIEDEAGEFNRSRHPAACNRPGRSLH